MANTKISALTSATTPLAGTEVLPIVQSSATVKVATNDLTVRNVRANATTGILQVTGPTAATTRVMTTPDANFTVARTDAAQSFTGDQTLSTGNLVIGTSGKGIDFTATAGSGTSELLADYEEGTWTPAGVLTTPGTSASSGVVGSYTKVGRIVTVATNFTFTKGTGTGNFSVSGLPYTIGSALVYTALTLQCENVGSALNVVGAYAVPSATTVQFLLMPQGTTATTVLTDTALGTTAAIRFSLTYAT
jgi:hypothetical protein